VEHRPDEGRPAHIKPGTTIAVLNGVPGIVESLGLPQDIWAIVETMNMRPLCLVGVDDTWSSFRLRPTQ
jgi:hypothetical protein